MLGFLVFLLFGFTFTSICDAGHRLPAPTRLQLQWRDRFTFNLSWSWEKPEDLPPHCEIEYLEDHGGQNFSISKTKREVTKNLIEGNYLTEDDPHKETLYFIKAHSKNCPDWSDSEISHIKISTNRPYAKLVKDFKCIVRPNNAPLNCSWIPVNSSQKLDIFYRPSGSSGELMQKIKKCDINTEAARWTCFMDIKLESSVYVAVESENIMNTFISKLAVSLPEVNITEDEDNLILTWPPTGIGESCVEKYTVQYAQCGEKNFKTMETKTALVIPYNKCCKYQFKYNLTIKGCLEITSDTHTAIYGTNKPCGRTAFIVAITIPVILTICVLLSLYCFRRNRLLICPKIPEPTNLFKEMMNGNSALKVASTQLYTAPPESIESKPLTLLPQKNREQEFP